MISDQRVPLIVVCAPEHPDVLRDQLARYEHEYDLRFTETSAQTLDLLSRLEDDDQVALLVAETEVPDAHVLRAIHDWRGLVPRPSGWSSRTSTTSATAPRSCVRAWPPASTTPTC